MNGARTRSDSDERHCCGVKSAHAKEHKADAAITVKTTFFIESTVDEFMWE
jgi:hypothetical protein